MAAPVTIVEFHELSAGQRLRLAGLKLSQQQIEYAGSVTKAMTDCGPAPQPHIRGFAILEGRTAVGFFILKRPPAAPDWADAGTVTLHGLMIDESRQGKGLGRAAFAAAIDAACSTWPEAAKLALTVDAGNEAAHGLYLAFGMRDSGPIYRGRIGLEHRLELDLPRPP